LQKEICVQEGLQTASYREQTSNKMNQNRPPNFYRMLNDLPALMCCFTSDGTLTFVNRTYCRYFNKTYEELVGNDFFQFIPKEDRQHVRDHFGSLTPDHPFVTYEHQVHVSNGEVKWQCWTDQALFDDDGGLLEYQSVGYDITEQKKAEKALQKNQAILHSVIENLPFEFFVINGTGRYIMQNATARELWGDIVGKYPEELTQDENILALWQDNNRRAFAGETVKENVSVTMHGQKRAYHNIIAPIMTDETVSGILGVNIDITERVMAEEALRESEEKYRGLVEDLNDVIYALDERAVVTYVSPNIEAFSGYRQSDVIGRQFTDFVHPEDIAGRIPQFLKVLSGNVEATEYRMITASGEVRWVRTAARPMLKNDCIVGLRGVLFDLTDRKRAEEERKVLETRLRHARKMEALGGLAGGVAHDLNNVLGGIVSYPELLLMQLPQDSPLTKPIEIIKKSGEKAAAIVQDLLTLARRGVPATEVVNLNDIVCEHLQTPEHALLTQFHPRVHVDVHLAADLMNMIGSPMHLSKTVMNLLSNAAEAMPEGGEIRVLTRNVHIDMPVKGYDEVCEGDYAVLTVTDTGVGISEADMERIFEPFYTKKKMGRSGTGLGMAVVWGTVKDHNGYIDIESREGQGTSFTLYFPATQAQRPVKDERIPRDDYMGRGEMILVVDDMAEQRELVITILTRLGYRAEAAASGEEAVEYLRHTPMDLVILDMIMEPGIDGLETYRRIIEFRHNQKAIIASGFSETDRVREAQKLGVGAYISKPYLMETIGMAVRSELDR